MPIKPPRPCTHPGCKEVVMVGSRCARHQYQSHAAYGQQRREHDGEAGFYSTSRWRACRAAFLRDNPLCCKCVYPTPATIVDHVVPIKQGGDRWSTSNMQPLCKPCHDRKTMTERHAGG
ncbi:MAG: HNH endonuclease [Magnetococcales bacterium]|nr:HNH endonuclease [Magnetococcales bacterium]